MSVLLEEQAVKGLRLLVVRRGEGGERWPLLPHLRPQILSTAPFVQ